jgi:protein-S-isoprenylcysteine O-methyltransferase Ste14
MNKLIVSTLLTFLIGGVALGALLFLPTGTLGYRQAWVFIGVFWASANAIGVYLSLKNPALLERRKQFGPASEQETSQKIISSLIIIGCFALLVFCGFDYRFGWSLAPWYVSLAGDLMVALGMYITLVVLQENSYSASNIRIEEGQKVISTGLYAVVRHPMYAGAVVMTIGAPLALGSWWGLAIIALMTPVLVWRILDEEQLLNRELPGYSEYAQKVRWRLAPWVW